MALINCPECNHEVSDKAKVCPNCGCPIKGVQRKEVAVGAINATGEAVIESKKRVAWKIVLIVLVAIVAIVVCGFFIFRDFWADKFLNDEEYLAYTIIKEFKKETGISGKIQEIAIDNFNEPIFGKYSKDIGDVGCIARWTMTYKDINLLIVMVYSTHNGTIQYEPSISIYSLCDDDSTSAVQDLKDRFNQDLFNADGDKIGVVSTGTSSSEKARLFLRKEQSEMEKSEQLNSGKISLFL